MSGTRPLGTKATRRAGLRWTEPVVDEQRLTAWSSYVNRLHAAIVRVRRIEGFDGGTCGPHLYRPLAPRWRAAP